MFNFHVHYVLFYDSMMFATRIEACGNVSSQGTTNEPDASIAVHKFEYRCALAGGFHIFVCTVIANGSYIEITRSTLHPLSMHLNL